MYDYGYDLKCLYVFGFIIQYSFFFYINIRNYLLLKDAVRTISVSFS